MCAQRRDTRGCSGALCECAPLVRSIAVCNWRALDLQVFITCLLTLLDTVSFQNSTMQEAYHANKGIHQLDLSILNGERALLGSAASASFDVQCVLPVSRQDAL